MASAEALLCEVCKSHSTSTLALKYCQTCREPLCKTCAELHKAFKVTRKHILVSSREHLSLKLSRDLEHLQICQKHQHKQTEFYCSDHASLLCSLCLFRTDCHRNCTNIIEIDNAGKSFLEKKFTDDLKIDYQRIIDSANYTVNEVKKATEHTRDNLKALKYQIQNIRTKMFEAFDRQTDHIIRTLCKDVVDNSSENKKACQSLDRLAELAARSEDLFKQVIDNGTPADVFRGIISLLGQSAELRKELEHTQLHCDKLKITVKKSDLVKILEMDDKPLLLCGVEKTALDVPAFCSAELETHFQCHLMAMSTASERDGMKQNENKGTTFSKAVNGANKESINGSENNETTSKTINRATREKIKQSDNKVTVLKTDNAATSESFHQVDNTETALNKNNGTPTVTFKQHEKQKTVLNPATCCLGEFMKQRMNKETVLNPAKSFNGEFMKQREKQETVLNPAKGSTGQFMEQHENKETVLNPTKGSIGEFMKQSEKQGTVLNPAKGSTGEFMKQRENKETVLEPAKGYMVEFMKQHEHKEADLNLGKGPMGEFMKQHEKKETVLNPAKCSMGEFMRQLEKQETVLNPAKGSIGEFMEQREKQETVLNPAKETMVDFMKQREKQETVLNPAKGSTGELMKQRENKETVLNPVKDSTGEFMKQHEHKEADLNLGKGPMGEFMKQREKKETVFNPAKGSVGELMKQTEKQGTVLNPAKGCIGEFMKQRENKETVLNPANVSMRESLKQGENIAFNGSMRETKQNKNMLTSLKASKGDKAETMKQNVNKKTVSQAIKQTDNRERTLQVVNGAARETSIQSENNKVVFKAINGATRETSREYDSKEKPLRPVPAARKTLKQGEKEETNITSRFDTTGESVIGKENKETFQNAIDDSAGYALKQNDKKEANPDATIGVSRATCRQSVNRETSKRVIDATTDAIKQSEKMETKVESYCPAFDSDGLKKNKEKACKCACVESPAIATKYDHVGISPSNNIKPTTTTPDYFTSSFTPKESPEVNYSTNRDKAVNIELAHLSSFDVPVQDKQIPWFSGIVCFQEETLILSDRKNVRLVMMRGGLCTTTKELEYFPGSLTICENVLIVCLLNTNKLLLMKIEDTNLREHRYLQTRFSPRCVQAVDKHRIIVSSKNWNNTWHLEMIALNGQNWRTNLDISLSGKYNGKCLAVQYLPNLPDTFRIIQFCENSDMVQCWRQEGGPVVFQYHVECATSVATDAHGYIFITRYPGEVQVLAPDGTFITNIRRKVMKNINYLAFNESTDKLFITSYKCSRVHVLSIKRAKNVTGSQRVPRS